MVAHAALMVPFATAAAYAGVAVVVLLARRQRMCALIVVASMECTPLRWQRTCAALVLASMMAGALCKFNGSFEGAPSRARLCIDRARIYPPSGGGARARAGAERGARAPSHTARGCHMY